MGARHPVLTFVGYTAGYAGGTVVLYVSTLVAREIRFLRGLKPLPLDLRASRVDLGLGTGLDDRSGHGERSVRNFLKNRRDRALGTILGHAEREIFGQLSESQCKAFRSVVLDAMNGYHDSVLDLVKAEDGARNDVVVEMLERLEQRLVAQSRAKAARVL